MLQSFQRFLFPKITYTVLIKAPPELVVKRLIQATTPVFFGIGRIRTDGILTTCNANKIRISAGLIGDEGMAANWHARLLRTTTGTVLQVSIGGPGRMLSLFLLFATVLAILWSHRWPEMLVLALVLFSGLVSRTFLSPVQLRRFDEIVFEWLQASLHPIKTEKTEGRHFA